MPRVASRVGGSKATKDAISSDLFGFSCARTTPAEGRKGGGEAGRALWAINGLLVADPFLRAEPWRRRRARGMLRRRSSDPCARGYGKLARRTQRATRRRNHFLRTCSATAHESLAMHNMLPVFFPTPNWTSGPGNYILECEEEGSSRSISMGSICWHTAWADKN